MFGFAGYAYIYSLPVPLHSLRQASRFRTLPITLPFSLPFLFWVLLDTAHVQRTVSLFWVCLIRTAIFTLRYLKCYLIMRLTYYYRIVDCLPKYNIGYFIRKRLFQAIGHCLKALPKRRPCSGLGTRKGSTLLFSTTARFCDIKQRRNCSFLTSRSIAITS